MKDATRTLVISKSTVQAHWERIRAAGATLDAHEMMVWCVENVTQSDTLAPGEEGVLIQINDPRYEFEYHAIVGQGTPAA